MTENYIKSLKVDEHAWQTITSEAPQAESQGIWLQSGTHLGMKSLWDTKWIFKAETLMKLYSLVLNHMDGVILYASSYVYFICCFASVEQLLTEEYQRSDAVLLNKTENCTNSSEKERQSKKLMFDALKWLCPHCPWLITQSRVFTQAASIGGCEACLFVGFTSCGLQGQHPTISWLSNANKPWMLLNHWDIITSPAVKRNNYTVERKASVGNIICEHTVTSG